ncbi:MAG TPA: glycosyltransferase [Mycobacteriales bacterium]|jgi:glycosyltransferase involved in cell wall biosynthesis|nr:glycosyltransferase [Mycobacteriales bacterium]
MTASDRPCVVIPVRNAAGLLERCLESTLAETRDRADVIVVDDASSDATADVAAAFPVDVLRHPEPRGPYAARNHGWRRSDATTIVLLDSRCRPRPGWLDGLIRAVDLPGVAIAGGDVVVTTAHTAAERYVQRYQPLMAEHGLGHPTMPFLPTANIVTHRSVLEAVDGFRSLRSGGDLDFCWRVQRVGLGRVEYAPGAAVDWVPRSTIREVMRQWYRYGAAKPTLAKSFAEIGLVAEPPAPPLQWWRSQLHDFAVEMKTSRRGDWDTAVVGLLCQMAWRSGYRSAWSESET